eukprot:TRINITY_DN27444_c0_g1_i2.p1 TRINITY_DN27444_c0_g1~~TRINITY_DN27444_c0_g1_i2.p1  ORF type:complete len:450 (+),score=81.98 TRINITY_DN27444_c0_g1_i2:78-1427(+)
MTPSCFSQRLPANAWLALVFVSSLPLAGALRTGNHDSDLAQPEGVCCCSANKRSATAEGCADKYDVSSGGFKASLNWQIQLGPAEFRHGQCCVRFAASSCNEIPNFSGNWGSYKSNWVAGEGCGEAVEGYGASLLGTRVTIHWARHGQACHNVEQKYGGGMGGCWLSFVPPRGLYDPPLSNCGEYNSQQAGEQAAEQGVFAEVGFFGSSSLLRTMQTANAMFPPKAKIVPLPYVKERGSSYCNTPGDFSRQQSKLRDLSLKTNATALKKRFDMKYMLQDDLRMTREDYGEFKRFFVNTVLRENPAALKSAIVSHSHYISDFVLAGDCGMESVKMNNNEMFTLEYIIGSDSSGRLQLVRDAETECKPRNVDVDMPDYLCASDWQSCQGNTPLDEVTKKLKKVKQYLEGSAGEEGNSAEKENYENKCCVPGRSEPIVKHKSMKKQQAKAYR